MMCIGVQIRFIRGKIIRRKLSPSRWIVGEECVNGSRTVIYRAEGENYQHPNLSYARDDISSVLYIGLPRAH